MSLRVLDLLRALLTLPGSPLSSARPRSIELLRAALTMLRCNRRILYDARSIRIFKFLVRLSQF